MICGRLRATQTTQNADMRSVADHAPSRLFLFCDALIEAVWLAAICVVPIVFNPHGGHASYQPFKFGFLRIVGFIGLAAWIVRTVEHRNLAVDLCSIATTFWRSPMAISLAVFALMIAVSTVFSVHSSVSLWGACETFGGAFTYAAELILFGLIAANLRTPEQIERLVTLSVVTSFAVSLFTILQRLGWDPQFPKLEADRAFGTAGHPIYLAGYLLMSIQLTIYRWLALRQESPRATAALRRIARNAYAIVFVTQLAAFFCAESRGPILALAVALIAFAVFYAASRE